MSPYLFTAVASALLCSLLTPVALLLAKRLRLLPDIRSRDVHVVRKPRVGGIAMWLSAVLVLATLAVMGGDWIGVEFPGLRGLAGIAAGLLVLLVVGLRDDTVGVSPFGQLVGQFVAASCLVVGGIGIPFIRFPWGGEMSLAWGGFSLPTVLGGGEYFLGITLFTVFWVMLIINVINWFDGLDGLAGSITLTGSVTLFFLSQRLGVGPSALLASITAGTVAGFLPWNWYPSKLFMGTVGSQLLAFMLATTAIISGGKVATAVLVLGIPLIDSVVVVVRRLLAGTSPFQADQRHLHHRLLGLGLSVPQVVLAIAGVSSVFALLAYRAQRSSEKGLLTLVLIALMGGVVWLTYYLEHKKMPLHKE